MPIYALDGIAPDIAPDAWIAPDANIIGNVRIGAGASVWFGATLRGDTEPLVIGEGANIQESAVLHADPGFPCTLGARATVGHCAIVHGATVGDEALIGMGATVLNGAKIGNQAIVGANALVGEGREVPEGSLAVGVPAKVIRTLDAAGRDLAGRPGRHYVANAQRYAKGLVRID